MHSDGGLGRAECFTGSRAILSGPAGGVVGYAMTTFSKESREQVIGFDMGGTSTDVSRFDGEYEWVHETEVAGVHLQVPQFAIRTVAAGGGSRLFFKNRLIVRAYLSRSAFINLVAIACIWALARSVWEYANRLRMFQKHCHAI